MRYILFLLPLLILGCGVGEIPEGDRLFNQKKYQEAIEAYNDVLETSPSDISSLYNRGRSYEELKQFGKAEQDFLKVVKLDEKNVSALLSLSKIYYQKEAYNKAVVFADKALEINENSAQGHFWSARAKHQLGYLDGAMESYSLAININRDYGLAYLYRGALKIFRKQNKSACADIQKAVNLDVPESKAIQKKYCK